MIITTLQSDSFDNSLLIFPVFLLPFIAIGIWAAYSAIMGTFGSTWIDIKHDTIAIERGLKRRGKIMEFPRSRHTLVENYSNMSVNNSPMYCVKLTNGNDSFKVVKTVPYDKASSVEQMMIQILNTDFTDL